MSVTCGRSVVFSGNSGFLHHGPNKADRHETRSVLFHFNGNTSYLTLNTKYIWAVLIKLHDSATYDDRRKSYEWLKHQAFKMQLISLKVYFLRNQSYRDKSTNQKQYLNCWTVLRKVLEIRTRIYYTSDCRCLAPIHQFFSYIMARTS